MAMQLPNFLLAGDLNWLRDSMGAPLTNSFRTNFSYRPIDLPEISQRLLGDGIDVGSFDEVKVLDDGTLSYRGYRVLLYIRDISDHGDRNTLPKYHLAFCRTLDQMKRNKRWARYVVANRDDGMFSVNFTGQNPRTEVSALDVCQNCLEKMAWDGFRNEMPRSNRLRYVRNFRLTEFFRKYPRDLIAVRPQHTSDTAPLNDYPENWGDISEKFKRRTGYRCGKCSRHLPGLSSRYLHVHHKNGQKNECHDANLEALCIACHADQPCHSHMKSLPDYLRFMESFGGSKG